MVASPSPSVLSSTGSSLTPTSSTPSTSTITPASYAAATYPTSPMASTPPVSPHRPYPLSMSSAHASTSTMPVSGARAPTSPHNTSRIPVTPAVLRSIFASSRSPGEERSLSRIAFFRYVQLSGTSFPIGSQTPPQVLWFYYQLPRDQLDG